MKLGLLIVGVLLSFQSMAQPVSIVSSFSTLTSLIEILIAEPTLGQNIKITTLINKGEDPHHYQANLKTLEKIKESQLIIINGLGFEPWMKKIIESSPNLKAKVFEASLGAEIIQNSRGTADPHSFNSPKNLKIYLQNLAMKLAELLPQKKSIIQKNKTLAIERLNKIIKTFESEFNKVPSSKRVIFTTHLSAQYLARDFNLSLHSLLGLSSVETLSMKQLSELKQKTSPFKNLTLFVDSTETELLAEKLKKELKFSTSNRIFLDGLPTNPTLDGISVIEFNLIEILKAIQN